MEIEKAKYTNENQDGVVLTFKDGTIFSIPSLEIRYQYTDLFNEWVENGGIVEAFLTQTELFANATEDFTNKTNLFIYAKINEYNVANGTAFDNIHNCESYSRLDGYTHQVWCLQAWTWSARVWEAVRNYQTSITSIPTDEEFQTVLNDVGF